MLVASANNPRVTLIVVALGRTERLAECLASLTAHTSATPFGIVCVINPVGSGDEASPAGVGGEPIGLADGIDARITVVQPAVNLGWPGGLHLGRRSSRSELIVWVQDDMVVTEGWLDALVAAADAAPDVGAFGSMLENAAGEVELFNAGWAEPVDDIDQWNTTDRTTSETVEEVTRFDWITSKGLLTRTVAWDAVGGPDPALFPLNHVDKDYCSHLRVHGWSVALVPGARLRHRGSQSAPSLLREFLSGWQHPRLTERWAEPLRSLQRAETGMIEHRCTRERADDVEGWVAREASRMLVDFSRWAERRRREAERRHLDLIDEVTAMRRTLSWRVTAPLRAARRLTR